MRKKSEIQATIEYLEDDVKRTNATIQKLMIADGMKLDKINELHNHKREILEKIRMLKWVLGESF